MIDILIESLLYQVLYIYDFRRSFRWACEIGTMWQMKIKSCEWRSGGLKHRQPNSNLGRATGLPCWFERVKEHNLSLPCGAPPKMELSSVKRISCSIGFPCEASVLGIHLHWCPSWHCCKRLNWLPWILFFEDSFNTFVHFMLGDLQAHLPTQHWVFSSFLPKTAWPQYPTLSIHLILPQVTFFCFPGWKKVLKGKHFANVEEVKQKPAEALKDIKSTSSKVVLSSGKNVLISVLHQMERTLKMIEV